MRRRFDQRVLSVVGLLVACHSEPIAGPEQPPRAEQPTSGASGTDSSDPQSGRNSGGNVNGGRDTGGPAQAGGGAGATQNSGGKAPVEPIPTEGGAAGERGVDAEGGAGNAPVYGPFEGPARCTSGRVRDPNESEGAEMNPGFACIFCHTASNAGTGEADAPIFTFAGTLYASAHEPDSCIGGGQDAARVIVKDASGVERSATANTSGNFLFEDAVLSPPFSIKIAFEGRERVATTPHVEPDCNRCHTSLGDQGAPGRVVLP